MKSYRSTKSKQKGLTLVELMAALVIIGIVVSVIGPMISKAVVGAESDSAARVTQGYLSDMHSKWRTAPFTGMNNAWAISAKIPHAENISGTSIINYWGNAMTISSGTLTGGVANGARQITDPVVPDACLQYVTVMSSFVDELVVGTTTVKPVGGTLNNATAATACDVSTTTVNVIMRKA